MSDLAERLKEWGESYAKTGSYPTTSTLMIEAADWIGAEPTRIRAAVEAERERAVKTVEGMLLLPSRTMAEQHDNSLLRHAAAAIRRGE